MLVWICNINLFDLPSLIRFFQSLSFAISYFLSLPSSPPSTASCFSLLLLFSFCPYIIPPHPGLYCSNCVLQRYSRGQETAAVPPLCHLQPDPRPMGLHPIPEGSL